MRKVGCPIEGIDIPSIFVAAIVEPLLFSHDIMRWKLLGHALADEHLGGAVGRGDQIGVTLVLNLESLMKIFEEQCASLAGDGGHGGNETLCLAGRGRHAWTFGIRLWASTDRVQGAEEGVSARQDLLLLPAFLG